MVVAYRKPLKIKVSKLNKHKKVEFRNVGMLSLYNIMQRPIDEEILEEALQNYNLDKHQIVQNMVVQAGKEKLLNFLGLTAENQGKAWTLEKIAEFLGETQEEVAKMKKGTQEVPTRQLKGHSKMIRFAVQTVCLKKDDKYLAEHVLMDAAKVFKGGKCD